LPLISRVGNLNITFYDIYDSFYDIYDSFYDIYDIYDSFYDTFYDKGVCAMGLPSSCLI